MTVPMERVEDRILTIHGHRVMVDPDLAEVYEVPTKRLNEQVKRNAESNWSQNATGSLG